MTKTHTGIALNEVADNVAKTAAKQQVSTGPPLRLHRTWYIMGMASTSRFAAKTSNRLTKGRRIFLFCPGRSLFKFVSLQKWITPLPAQLAEEIDAHMSITAATLNLGCTKVFCPDGTCVFLGKFFLSREL